VEEKGDLVEVFKTKWYFLDEMTPAKHRLAPVSQEKRNRKGVGFFGKGKPKSIKLLLKKGRKKASSGKRSQTETGFFREEKPKERRLLREREVKSEQASSGKEAKRELLFVKVELNSKKRIV
jgi:hypothetical protein